MVALLKFGTKNCNPCKMLDKLLENLPVEKIDCHDHPEIATHYGIQSVPVVIVLRDNQVIDKIVGVQPYSHYAKYVEEK